MMKIEISIKDTDPCAFDPPLDCSTETNATALGKFYVCQFVQVDAICTYVLVCACEYIHVVR